MVNGSPTSYEDTFATGMKYVLSKLDMQVDQDIWSKFGPYSCTLNIDEVDDLDKTWADIAEKVGQPV